MKSYYSEFLGVKLSDEENKALTRIAQNNGIQKSSYARHILRMHLIQVGEITITNPAAQGSEITAQGSRD